MLRRQEEIQAELEACGSDMDRMAPILDELDALSKKVGPPGSAFVVPIRSQHRRPQSTALSVVMSMPRRVTKLLLGDLRSFAPHAERLVHAGQPNPFALRGLVV